jgi:hypothetical protein
VECQIQQAVWPNSLHGCSWYFWTEKGVHIDWIRWKWWQR